MASPQKGFNKMPSEEEIAASKAAAEKEAADAKAKADADAAAEAAKKAEEQKAGDINKRDETKMVPEWQLIEAKKAAQKKIDALEARLSSGETDKDISDDVKEIYDAYPDVDKKFIDMILSKAKSAAKSEIEPITKEQKARDIDAKFQKNFKIAMEKLGKDFDGIVNEDVIKKLTLLPENADKTFSQIIEETYGASLTGRRTIETTKPGGGKDPAPLNFDKARKDSKYFDEVMADPKLKAEYNKRMLEEGF